MPRDAGRALDLSLAELGPGATADQRARRCFIRAILHHYQRSPGRALEDAGTVLRDLDLSSPLGYFLDTLAFIACFLQRTADPSHARQALADLQEFRRRLHGVSGFTAVRTRLAWVEGQVCARLHEWRRAHDCLGRPLKTQDTLARLRRSFIVPVPGIVVPLPFETADLDTSLHPWKWKGAGAVVKSISSSTNCNSTSATILG